MISFSEVEKTFDNIPILRDITFELAAGERVSLIGPGGSGKTTILKLLLGLIPPSRGEVNLLDTPMHVATEKQKSDILSHVGMAFQQGGLFDFMTVRDNLLFAMEHMTSLTKPQMEERVLELLDGVKLGRTVNLYPHELSGGMKRRVGIARALSNDPRVAIFDEPTSGLDPVTSTIILNMILELAGSSKDNTLLVATTNVEIALRFADRIVVVHEGYVVADGPWRELLLVGPDWVRNFLSVRLVGLDREYVEVLDLPKSFIDRHWK